MRRTASFAPSLSHAWIEGVSWLAGAAFTFVLFSGLARIGNTATPVAEVEELRLVALPVELPPVPPAPTEQAAAPEEALPLVGIDAGSSDSSVKIRALPPDFAALLARAPVAPRRIDSLGRIPTGLKPPAEASQVDIRHIYQQSEVDQAPRAVHRAIPSVPHDLFGKSGALRVTVLLTIDRAGQVENARVAKSSGQPIYDALVIESIKYSWEFSPAIRRGQRVRCFAEQTVTMILPGNANPFGL
ncbi:MAG TPA: TonB family protein [Lacunisphaera sp.]|nr:TonB family protein [Lacunisphaera sp.]